MEFALQIVPPFETELKPQVDDTSTLLTTEFKTPIPSTLLSILKDVRMPDAVSAPLTHRLSLRALTILAAPAFRMNIFRLQLGLLFAFPLSTASNNTLLRAATKSAFVLSIPHEPNPGA